jgi:hypothetical protein
MIYVLCLCWQGCRPKLRWQQAGLINSTIDCHIPPLNLYESIITEQRQGAGAGFWNKNISPLFYQASYFWY